MRKERKNEENATKERKPRAKTAKECKTGTRNVKLHKK